MMEVRIENKPAKKFIGKRLNMSLVNDKTLALWQSFMPERRKIVGVLNQNLYSITVHPENYFSSFDPSAEFEKWATVEADAGTVPAEMESFSSPAGLYAVFLYKGLSGEGAKAYQYIFNTWLPGSGYVLDQRPHLTVMGEKYKNDDPESEEELWIPVRKRLDGNDL